VLLNIENLFFLLLFSVFFLLLSFRDTDWQSYLSDEEFASVFNMSKDDYAKKPQWKREELKKKANLY
jgi:hypothetical protein